MSGKVSNTLILFAGDDKEAKQVVVQLIQDAGFPGLDVGPLESARLLESMGLLLHHIAEAQNYSALNLAPTFLTPLSKKPHLEPLS